MTASSVNRGALLRDRGAVTLVVIIGSFHMAAQAYCVRVDKPRGTPAHKVRAWELRVVVTSTRQQPVNIELRKAAAGNARRAEGMLQSKRLM